MSTHTLITPITQTDLDNAQTLLNQGGPSAMYEYLAGFGDRYSVLAQGVLDGSTLSGQAALEFMQHTAEQQGRTLTEAEINNIRTEMATGYLQTLQGILNNSNDGLITREIDAKEAWAFHNKVFTDNNLGPDAWTLNTPFKLFGEEGAQSYWESVLDSAGDSVKEVQLSFTTLELMALWSDIVPHDLALQMQNWLDRFDNLDATWDLSAAGFGQFFDAAQAWFTDFMEVMGGPQGIWESVWDFWSGAINWTQPVYRDPFVLDLDGDGIETTTADGTTLFDHNGDGIKHATGWVGSDDGILVMDRNGNGLIDNGSELFGENTVKSDDTLATDGYDALSDIDTNLDGQIDVNDAKFNDLRVWRDLNQDSISQSNELFSLTDLGIQSIGTTGTAQNTALAGDNGLELSAAIHIRAQRFDANDFRKASA